VYKEACLAVHVRSGSNTGLICGIWVASLRNLRIVVASKRALSVSGVHSGFIRGIGLYGVRNPTCLPFYQYIVVCKGNVVYMYV
jgi:hypothetical protein